MDPREVFLRFVVTIRSGAIRNRSSTIGNHVLLIFVVNELFGVVVACHFLQYWESDQK